MSALDTDTRLLRLPTRPSPKPRGVTRDQIPDFQPEQSAQREYDGRHRWSQRITPKQISAALNWQADRPTAVISAVRLAALAGPQQPAPVPVPAPVPEPAADPQMRTLARLMSNLRSARWRP